MFMLEMESCLGTNQVKKKEEENVCHNEILGRCSALLGSFVHAGHWAVS